MVHICIIFTGWVSISSVPICASFWHICHNCTTCACSLFWLQWQTSLLSHYMFYSIFNRKKLPPNINYAPVEILLILIGYTLGALLLFLAFRAYKATSEKLKRVPSSFVEALMLTSASSVIFYSVLLCCLLILINPYNAFISGAYTHNYVHDGMIGKKIDNIGVTVSEIVGNQEGAGLYDKRVDKVTICNMRSTPIKASVSDSDIYWSMHSSDGKKFTGTASYSGLGGAGLNPGMCMHTYLSFRVPQSLVQGYVTVGVSGITFYMPMQPNQ